MFKKFAKATVNYVKLSWLKFLFAFFVISGVFFAFVNHDLAASATVGGYVVGISFLLSYAFNTFDVMTENYKNKKAKSLFKRKEKKSKRFSSKQEDALRDSLKSYIDKNKDKAQNIKEKLKEYS